MINCKSQYVKCKEGLIAKHISRIRTAVKINANLPGHQAIKHNVVGPER